MASIEVVQAPADPPVIGRSESLGMAPRIDVAHQIVKPWALPRHIKASDRSVNNGLDLPIRVRAYPEGDPDFGERA